MAHLIPFSKKVTCILEKNPKDLDGSTPLHEAADHGNDEIYKIFVEYLQGQDKNPADDHGNTPLHLVAIHGYTNICKLIIEEIEDKDFDENENGSTPLHIAAEHGNLGIYRFGFQKKQKI